MNRKYVCVIETSFPSITPDSDALDGNVREGPAPVQ